ncbi:hypothetical protein GCM10022220_38030 [Actinocatenispora rupis]|uniref:Uncharacterized protein n=1 Tax=Actinocatenispora rupis TaxID=519421 RepID=A0A8J3NE22_9ACTN|nr:hypothetical protein Aru02nite_29930 [Actinocatenispora rupis]
MVWPVGGGGCGHAGTRQGGRVLDGQWQTGQDHGAFDAGVGDAAGRTQEVA